MPPLARSLSLVALLVPLFASAEAAATGMQGHIYMAQCAAEQATDPRLRAMLDAQAQALANGAFFPDSGYTADDHDQGEIPHWEQYVQGYVELIRERYAAPYDGPEAQAEIAFLLGIAAHGITDSTFDALLMDRAAQIEPGNMDSFDMAMDIFLVHDKPRYFVPEIAHDTQMLADVFNTKINHPVTPKAIDDAVSTAWSGISIVAKYMYLGADDWGTKYPFARASLLDARTPGGYPFGSKVVLGYYRELLRRIDGKPSADDVVIGAYPNAEVSLVTLDASRPDGKIVFFFGEGLDRAAIDDSSVVVRDEAGNVVPTTVSVFRGDKWANVLRVTAANAWLPTMKYTATLGTAIKTLQGVSPTKDHVLSFVTCTPKSPGGDCEAAQGPAPASPCPKLDALYAPRPDLNPPDETTDPPPQVNPTPETSSACAAAPVGEGAASSSLVALATAFCALLSRRRKAG